MRWDKWTTLQKWCADVCGVWCVVCGVWCANWYADVVCRSGLALIWWGCCLLHSLHSLMGTIQPHTAFIIELLGRQLCCLLLYSLLTTHRWCYIHTYSFCEGDARRWNHRSKIVRYEDDTSEEILQSETVKCEFDKSIFSHHSNIICLWANNWMELSISSWLHGQFKATRFFTQWHFATLAATVWLIIVQLFNRVCLSWWKMWRHIFVGFLRCSIGQKCCHVSRFWVQGVSSGVNPASFFSSFSFPSSTTFCW